MADDNTKQLNTTDETPVEEPTPIEEPIKEEVAEGDGSQTQRALDEEPEATSVPEAAEGEPQGVSTEGAVSEQESGSTDQSEKITDEQPTVKSNDNPNARWYVVHTYSGHENKVAVTLKQRIESEHLQDKILDVLVPMQDKIEIKSGKKVTIKEKIFPGYILVKMVLDDISWLAVRTTQGVTSFVGMGNKPTPISEAEVQTIVKFTQSEAPVYKQVFAADDTVKIVDGPFSDFIGKIDNVDEERGKVKVLVSIFGRETPVELDFLQVQKI